MFAAQERAHLVDTHGGIGDRPDRRDQLGRRRFGKHDVDVAIPALRLPPRSDPRNDREPADHLEAGKP